MLLFWQCCNSVTSINLIKYKIQRQTTFHFRFSLTRKPWNCPQPPMGIVCSRECKNTHGLYGSLNGVSWRRSSVELSAYESVQWDSFHCKFFGFYTERSLDFSNFFFFTLATVRNERVHSSQGERDKSFSEWVVDLVILCLYSLRASSPFWMQWRTRGAFVCPSRVTFHGNYPAAEGFCQLIKGLKRALYTKETCVMPPFV